MEEKKIRNILIAICIAFSAFAFYNSHSGRDYRITVCNGSGLTYMETFIYCDSFEMVSTKEVNFWVDGKEQKVLATSCIRVETN
jgi:hypothetical protein